MLMYDDLEKPKHKPSRDVISIDALLTFFGSKPEQFQFTVEVPITVCIERLTAMDEKRNIFGYVMGRPHIQVNVQQKKDEGYRVNIHAQLGRFPWISIDCHVEKQADSLTLITGSAKTDYSSWQVNLMLIFIPLLLLAFILAQTVIFAIFIPQLLAALIAILVSVIFMISILSGNIAFATLNRQEFIRFMQDTMRFGRYQGLRKKKSY
jgi:hypothetical protein